MSMWSRYSRRIVPISRSTNGCDIGAYGTDLISSPVAIPGALTPRLVSGAL